MTLRKKVNIFISISLVVCGIFWYFIPKEYFAFSEKSCDYIYPYKIDLSKLLINNKDYMNNLHCKEKVAKGKTLFTWFKKNQDNANFQINTNSWEARINERYGITDAQDCENEKNRSAKAVCYFKKAYDSKDIKYCKEDPTCILNLAGILKEKSFCNSEALLEKTQKLCYDTVSKCMQNINSDSYCKPVLGYSCKGVISTERQSCEEKYNINL